MRATNIRWDTNISMPDEIKIPEHIAVLPFDEIEEAISDYITETTGGTPKGFDIESDEMSEDDLLGFDARKMRYNLYSYAQTKGGKGLNLHKIEGFFDQWKRTSISTLTLIDLVQHEIDRVKTDSLTLKDIAGLLISYIDKYGDEYEIMDQMETGESRDEYLARLLDSTEESLKTTEGIVNILCYLEQDDNPEALTLTRMLLRRRQLPRPTANALEVGACKSSN